MSDVDTTVLLAESAAEAAVQRALSQGLTLSVRHGTVAVVNTTSWIHQVLLDGDNFNVQAHDVSACGAFVGARVTVLFAPPHQALILSAHRTQTGAQRWPVQWTAAGNDPVLNDGVLVAEQERQGQRCDIHIWLSIGASTNGGTLGWEFLLPFPAAADIGEQILPCKAFTTGGGNWWGYGYIQPGGQILRPFFPFNGNVSFLGQAQNADGGGGAGTGIPLVAGQYSWTNGMNLVVDGRYKVAP
jgi:hypothetical protein